MCLLLLLTRDSDHSPIAATFELIKPHLPNTPQLLKPKVECTISITNLVAQGLRSVNRNGSANPYVIFDVRINISFFNSASLLLLLLLYINSLY